MKPFQQAKMGFAGAALRIDESMGHLVFSRKEGENFFIGDDIEVIVSRVDAGVARIVISAPREIRVLRGEIYARLDEAPASSQGNS